MSDFDTLSLEDLLAACAPGGSTSLLSETPLQPAGGPGAVIAPAKVIEGRQPWAAERAPLVEELSRHVLEQAYFIPLEQNVQRIYVQSPELTGISFNAVAIPSYHAARKEQP